MLDWLRDMEELREYAETYLVNDSENAIIAVLKTDHKSILGNNSLELAEALCWNCGCFGRGLASSFDYSGEEELFETIYEALEEHEFSKIISWFPWDVAHYKAWKAEREKQDCPNCEDGYTPVFHGDMEDREECPKCKGTGAIGGYNIEKGYFWDGECPTCNGMGTVAQKEE